MNPTRNQPDVVAAVGTIGDAVVAAAHIYGATCGGVCRVFPTVERFRHWARHECEQASSVLVFLPEALFTMRTARSVIQLGLARRLAIGLYPVGDLADVHTFVRRNAHDQTANWPLLVYSELPVDLDARPAADTVLGPHDSDTFVDLAGDRPAAIVICAHGNGADFKLGSSVGCVAAAPNQRLRPGGALVCQHGGPCLRERLKPRHFVGPQGLNSPLIVLLSCTSTPTSDAILPWSNSFAVRLFEHGNANAVVGSYMLHQERASWATDLSTWLTAGKSAGEIARLLNDDAVSEPSFLCMGNPAIGLASASPRWVHLSTRTVLPEVEAATDTRDEAAPAASVAPAHRALQARLVAELFADEPRPMLRDATEQLYARLMRDRGDDEQLDRCLCDYLVAFVAEGVFLHKYWQQGFEFGFAKRATGVHGCGSRLFRQTARSAQLPDAARCLWWCERCGTVGDTPAATSLPRFRAGPRGFEFETLGQGPDGWLASATEAIGNHVLPPSRAARLSSYRSRGRHIVSVDGFHWPGLQWRAAVLVARGQFLVVRAPVDVVAATAVTQSARLTVTPAGVRVEPDERSEC